MQSAKAFTARQIIEIGPYLPRLSYNMEVTSFYLARHGLVTDFAIESNALNAKLCTKEMS